MKTRTLFILGMLFATSVFADTRYWDPIFWDGGLVSGEAQIDEPIVMNAAPDAPNNSSASGEINIEIPFDPNEQENVNNVDPVEQLNAAAEVETGAGMMLVFMIAVLLSTLLYKQVYLRKD